MVIAKLSLGALKFGLLGAAGMAVVSGLESMGIPKTAQIFVDGFVTGCLVVRWAGSYVGGLPRPNYSDPSTRGYQHYYDTCHLLFNRATHSKEGTK